MIVSEQVRSFFKINAVGVVLAPGHFQGQHDYVIHYYDLFCDGLADVDMGDTIIFNVTDEDRKLFPALQNRSTVMLSLTADGVSELLSN